MVGQWIALVNDIIEMKQLTTALKCKEEQFNKTWFYWHDFCYSEDYNSYLSDTSA